MGGEVLLMKTHPLIKVNLLMIKIFPMRFNQLGLILTNRLSVKLAFLCRSVVEKDWTFA